MNDRLLRALRREPVDRTPVWLMRQAGRYLPEYREARQGRDFTDVMQDPEAAAELTRLPLERFPLDAAVIFSDISTPFLAAGVDYTIKKGVGPYVEEPVTSGRHLDRLTPFEPRESLGFVLEEIRVLRRSLDVPVVGFVGAPFTLCSYLVEAPRSKRLAGAKRFMWHEPDAWAKLMEYWATHLAEYAIAQHEAGAHAIQVFDSWAGVLTVDDYRAHVMPHSQALLSRLRDAGVPSIHFYTGNPRLLPLVAEAGGDCVSVDWRCPLDDAWAAIGPRAIQGNLDPVALTAKPEVAAEKARDVMRRAAGRPGHVFNLGHGCTPDARVDSIQAVVDAVHDHAHDDGEVAA